MEDDEDEIYAQQLQNDMFGGAGGGNPMGGNGPQMNALGGGDPFMNDPETDVRQADED